MRERRSHGLPDEFPSLANSSDEESPRDKYSKTRRAAQPACSARSMCRSFRALFGLAAVDDYAPYWLLAAGIFTRFAFLTWPPQVVFDEFHFGKFVSGYITGRYFFDIHPPLGKLLIALAAHYSGYDGSQAFAKIGEPYKSTVNVFALRAVPATFGATLVPLTYLVSRQFGCSQHAALLVAGLVLLDGALLVESRLILTDSSLFFWELLQLLCMLRASAARPNSASFHAYLSATGFAIGCAVSTKWTALATMAVVGLESIRSLVASTCAVLSAGLARRASLASTLPTTPVPHDDATGLDTHLDSTRHHSDEIEFASPWQKATANAGLGRPPVVHESPQRRATRCARARKLLVELRPVAGEFAARFVWLLMLPLAIYVICFILHLHFLPYTGSGDAFHTPSFRCRLKVPPILLDHQTHQPPANCVAEGCKACEHVQALSMRGAILALNRRMLSANAGIKRGHSFGSKWHLWPLNSKPVFYWSFEDSGRLCRIYMAGNPFVWFFALSGTLVALLVFIACCKTVVRNGCRICSKLCGKRQRHSQVASLTRSGAGPCKSHAHNVTNTQLSGCNDVEFGQCDRSSGLVEGQKRGSSSEPEDPLRHGWLLVIGHLLGWLPFAWVERVAFLYHYLPSLLLSLIAAGLALDWLTSKLERACAPRYVSLRSLLVSLLLLVTLRSFCHFLPLYIGLPIDSKPIMLQRTHQLDVLADTWMRVHRILIGAAGGVM